MKADLIRGLFLVRKDGTEKIFNVSTGKIEKIVECINCGALCPESWDYCDYCGNTL